VHEHEEPRVSQHALAKRPYAKLFKQVYGLDVFNVLNGKQPDPNALASMGIAAGEL
jgi:hypothetical protein